MSDRLAGSCIAILAIGFFIAGLQLETPFFADPLGPSAFPLLVAGVGFIAGCTMILKPDAEPNWPILSTLVRLGLSLGILVLYAFGLKPLGFLLPTALGAAGISYLIRPTLVPALITGAGLSVGLFILFKYALGLGLFAFPRSLFG